MLLGVPVESIDSVTKRKRVGHGQVSPEHALCLVPRGRSLRSLLPVLPKRIMSDALGREQAGNLAMKQGAMLYYNREHTTGI
eukprot:2632506-Amphidinium_carterae.2